MSSNDTETGGRTCINVIGASGCGVTSVGRLVATELAVPYFDSDDYFHAPSDPPFSVQNSPEERHRLIVSDLGKHRDWVVGGGVGLWEPAPFLDCTLMVYLTVPTEIRLERLRERELARFGDRIKKGGDMYETHEEFLTWAAAYDEGGVEGKTAARHERFLTQQTCPVLRLSGTLNSDESRDRVLIAMGAP